jgi:DIM1 family U5 snRNP protein
MVDIGTGNNNKLNWALTDKQGRVYMYIIEVIYRGASKGLPYKISVLFLN